MSIFQCMKARSPLFLFASICVAAVLKLILKLRSKERKQNLPPSPPKLPIIGNLHQLGNMPHQSPRRLAEKFGPIIYLQLGQIPTVVVSSFRMTKEVMETHDLALSSHLKTFPAKHILCNFTDMTFASYGAYWQHVCKICILELLSARRVQSFSFVREEEVARLVQRAAEFYASPNDLTKFVGMYANSIIFRVAFSKDYSEGGGYERHGFQTLLEEFQVLLGGFSAADFFPSMEFIHSLTGMKSKLENNFQCFDQFFDEVIEEHLDPKREKEVHKNLGDVLLDIH